MFKRSLIFRLLSFILFVHLLSSCKKSDLNVNGYKCPENLKVTASSVTPTVGDDLTIYANTGKIIYYWSGPLNFAVQTGDSRDRYQFPNIKIKQSGWYVVGASLPGCFTIYDSIYIDVKYKQGTPPCSLINNAIRGNGVPTLQASSVTKSFSRTYNGKTLYAAGTFGDPTYTFLFNSYNGDVEPKDGIYITTNVPSFSPLQDENLIHVRCMYSNFFFQSYPDQNVFVSHVNGKLRISFCDLNFGGDNGNGYYFTSVFSGQVTEN